uniref:Uncharacterized protein n=1 Tax=Magallana gigas TaxID=29159 RepID=K1Q5P8_MAGGI
MLLGNVSLVAGSIAGCGCFQDLQQSPATNSLSTILKHTQLYKHKTQNSQDATQRV